MMRCALALVCVARVAGQFVVELNDANFDTVVDGSRHVLVEFFKPDCGHCQTMEPEFYVTAEALEYDGDVVLARVDTEESPRLRARFDIDGHPIFKWFRKGETEADKFYFVHYGGRMANTFLKMIGERVGRAFPELEIEYSKVVKIKAEAFDEVVLSPAKAALAVLYTPWTENKHVAEALDTVAKLFEDVCVVAKLPIERVFERDIADRYACRHYPCFEFFSAGDNERTTFDGPFDDPEPYVHFLNEKLGTSRVVTAPRVQLGRVALLDAALSAVPAARTAELARIAEMLTAQHADFAKYYVKTSAKIEEQGASFVGVELSRITQLLANPSISQTKRKDFVARKNILTAFLKVNPAENDEL